MSKLIQEVKQYKYEQELKELDFQKKLAEVRLEGGDKLFQKLFVDNGISDGIEKESENTWVIKELGVKLVWGVMNRWDLPETFKKAMKNREDFLGGFLIPEASFLENVLTQYSTKEDVLSLISKNIKS